MVTSSTQGRHGTKDGAAYSASKWGITGLMKFAALELGQYGITVNAIIPGLIDTSLTRHRQRYAQAIDDLSNSKPPGRARSLKHALSSRGAPPVGRKITSTNWVTEGPWRSKAGMNDLYARPGPGNVQLAVGR
nr:SDR family NAD(P)-dependent oxidoreductase [Burkholderia pseudomultivorans]